MLTPNPSTPRRTTERETMKGTQRSPGGGGCAAPRSGEPGLRRRRITEAGGGFQTQGNARLCPWPELQRLPLRLATNSPELGVGRSDVGRQAGSGQRVPSTESTKRRDPFQGAGRRAARRAGSSPASAARPESPAHNFLCPRAAERARGGHTRAIYRSAASGWGWLPGEGERKPGDPNGAAPAWRYSDQRGAHGSWLPGAEAAQPRGARGADSVCAPRGAPRPAPAPAPRLLAGSSVWARGGGCGSPRPPQRGTPPRALRCQPGLRGRVGGGGPARSSAGDPGTRAPAGVLTRAGGAAGRRCLEPSSPGKSAWEASGAHLPAHTANPTRARPGRVREGVHSARISPAKSYP